MGADQPWIKFLSGTGAIVLTFLAGAEIDPDVFRQRWKEASVIGLISALFGLSHGIIDKGQYSLLLAVVIGSAVVPTIIANAWFVPKYLLPKFVPSGKTAPAAAGMGAKTEG
jgi:Kef-type K+ transport system membrane component KefB